MDMYLTSAQVADYLRVPVKHAVATPGHRAPRRPSGASPARQAGRRRPLGRATDDRVVPLAVFDPSFPTDRDRVAPVLGVGVDTIAVMGPTTEALLERFSHDEIDWKTGEYVGTLRCSWRSTDVGLASATLLAFRNSGQPFLRIELSLPTMLNGHNRNALGLLILTDAVEVALILLAEQLPDIPEPDRVTVQRLDLPRDFHDVQSTTAVLSAMHRRHIPHARVNQPHYLSDGSMQSLIRGSKSSYLVRGYDKARELSQHARRDRARRPLLEAWADISPGQLRFEPQVRAPILRKKGITGLYDATVERLEGLSEEMFTRARWAEPYGGRGRVQRTLEGLRPTLSPADYRNLSAYVFWERNGMKVELSRHVLDRVRPIARRNNLLDPDDDRERRRLDFVTGEEVEVR